MKAIVFTPGSLVFLAIAVSASAQSPLPEGPSQKLVELVCSKCHTTDRIASKAMTKAEWKEEVTEMLQEEDDVTEAEKDEIIDYLARNFPAKADDDKAKSKEKTKEKELVREMFGGGPAVIVRCGQQNSLSTTFRVPTFHNSGKMSHQRVGTINVSTYGMRI